MHITFASVKRPSIVDNAFLLSHNNKIHIVAYVDWFSLPQTLAAIKEHHPKPLITISYTHST